VPERADWAKLSAGWTARIRDRIAELERLQAGLTECIGCGCLSLDRCRLANPAIGQRAVARAPLLDGKPYFSLNRHRRTPERFTIQSLRERPPVDRQR
jgi:hypothetical protein